MRLQYSSRKGNFDYGHPSDVSISTHIAVYDDEGKRIKSTNVQPDYLANGDDIDEAIELIEQQKKSVWFSTAEKDWNEMVTFLEANREAIDLGSQRHLVKQLRDKAEHAHADLAKAEQALAYLERNPETLPNGDGPRSAASTDATPYQQGEQTR